MAVVVAWWCSGDGIQIQVLITIVTTLSNIIIIITINNNNNNNQFIRIHMLRGSCCGRRTPANKWDGPWDGLLPIDPSPHANTAPSSAALHRIFTASAMGAAAVSNIPDHCCIPHY